MTDADFRKLQLDYYKNNPKGRALPFEDFLKEVKNDQDIREAVRPSPGLHRASDLSKKEKSIKEAVGSNRHKGPRSDRHRASDLLGHDHHSHGSGSARPQVSPRMGAHSQHSALSARDSHGSRSARPQVSPRMGAHSQHSALSARGMDDQHSMAGHAFEDEPRLPRQQGGLRGTGTHDRDGIFEDRGPSGRVGGHHGPGRHARQAEGLNQDTMAEGFGGMHLGDQGHHGHRSGPHGSGSRTGPPDDVHDEFQYTSRGSRGGAREPPNREELPPRRGHNGGRSVREADLQPLGSRRAAPIPLSSRHQTASARPQHSLFQGGPHHTPRGGSSQHPGFQGSQGGRGGRDDDFW